MKELRPASAGRSEVRILFAIDPQRQGRLMARSWKDVKADKERSDRAAGRDVDAARAEARTRTQAYVLGFRLAQLRQEVGLSQSDVATRMGVSQPRVSQLESGDVGQMEVDTLARYVLALGGRLKLVADFEDHDVDVSATEADRDALCKS